MFFDNLIRSAGIAQWSERLFCKQRVGGSNPSFGSNLNFETMEMCLNPQEAAVGGVYRHFTGSSYEVLMVGRSVENGQKMVVYKALEGESTDPQVWCIYESLFLAEVTGSNGTIVPRFRYLRRRSH